MLFDLEATQPLQHCLQICQETGWAHDNHPSIAKGILNKIAARATLPDIVDKQIIIQRLAGDKHKGKVHRIFAGANVFACLVDALLEVELDAAQQLLALVFAHGIDHPVVVLKAEFAIDRQYASLVKKNHRIDRFSISKAILHLILSRWQHVLKHALQIIFTKDTALLGVLQDVLQCLELICYIDDASISLIQLREALCHIGHQLGTLGELLLD